MKKGVLRNFAKFAEKNLCESLFFNKVAGQTSNFIKKETLAQGFFCEFCEISKNIFFTEHLWTTASRYLTAHLQLAQRVSLSCRNFIAF